MSENCRSWVNGSLVGKKVVCFNPFLDLRPDCGFQSAKIRYKYRGEPGVNYSIISMITIVDLSSQSKNTVLV